MQPLAGYRVVACEVGLAGPICSRLLADLGAEVVKVERPGSGDVTRGWDTGAAGLSTGFVWVNRGKRSVALDLKRAEARAALDRLIERSDVFLVNFAPGWAGSMGLDEASVRRLRPDVVYTEITGYGSDGPYAGKNAYDLVVQGEAGLIAMTGTPAEPARISIPVRRYRRRLVCGDRHARSVAAPRGDRRGRARLGVALRRHARLDGLLPALLVASSARSPGATACGTRSSAPTGPTGRAAVATSTSPCSPPSTGGRSASRSSSGRTYSRTPATTRWRAGSPTGPSSSRSSRTCS